MRFASLSSCCLHTLRARTPRYCSVLYTSAFASQNTTGRPAATLDSIFYLIVSSSGFRVYSFAFFYLLLIWRASQPRTGFGLRAIIFVARLRIKNTFSTRLVPVRV